MLLLLVASIVMLHRELAGVGTLRLRESLTEIPSSALLLAIGLTVVAYLLLSGYDLLALRYVDAGIGRTRTVLTSLIAYALSQTLGFPLFTGGAIRVRYWSMWGLSGPDIARATSFVSTTFAVGVASVCGLALLLEPSPLLAYWHVPALPARAIGALLLLGVMAYLTWAVARSGSVVHWRRWTLPVPPPTLAVAQVVLGLLDWSVAGMVAYVLLPAGHSLTPVAFLGVFALAQFVGVMSHVPGGVGVFETIMLLVLRGSAPPASLLTALLAYRTIYYLMPFAIGVLTLTAIEMYQYRSRVPAFVGAATTSATAALGLAQRVAIVLQPLLPSTIAISTFIGGALLLFSGATPAAHGRVRALTAVLPLGLVELSHFTGSLAGVGLLVLAAALRRRLDAAWGATVALLSLGIAASLLKGLDWEEASVLAVVLVAVVMSRRAFYRPATLTADVLTPGWMIAVVGVVAASVWLGMLAYRHVDYSHAMWWEFAARGNAPRFLRASAGAIVAVFTAGLWLLFRPAALEPVLPTREELSRAEAIIHRVPESTPALALLGDKALLFSDCGDAFVMYGVSGRSWIAMGDPVGVPARFPDVAWRFKEEADAHGAIPVFYQVTPSRLPLYVDLGMTLLKLGEEAVVPLETFSVDGADHRWMRRVLKESEKHQLRFEIVPPDQVLALLPVLRAISDAWLGGKTTREKGFSLGRFDEAYLRHFPMALVHAPSATSASGSQIVAFANLWAGQDGGELSPDLMRRSADAPKGTMDFLFVQLMLWGKAHGYRACNIGMAPLAGLRDTALARPELAPLWARAGAFLYGRGDTFYNFQGLRAFKEKFSPVWEPRYLASPGGIALPRVLTNVASLIAGGVGGIVRK